MKIELFCDGCGGRVDVSYDGPGEIIAVTACGRASCSKPFTVETLSLTGETKFTITDSVGTKDETAGPLSETGRHERRG